MAAHPMILFGGSSKIMDKVKSPNYKMSPVQTVIVTDHWEVLPLLGGTIFHFEFLFFFFSINLSSIVEINAWALCVQDVQYPHQRMDTKFAEIGSLPYQLYSMVEGSCHDERKQTELWTLTQI